MHRIDNATSAAALPTPQPVGPQPNSYFQPQAILEADWLNSVQEEIVNVILSESIPLDKTFRNQLLAAIVAKITLARLGITQSANEINQGVDYAGQYLSHEAAVPNMTVVIDAGRMMVNNVMVINAQQTGALSPAHATLQRIDRFTISETTGIVFGVLGTPAASPVAPAIPAGYLPICQVLIPALDTAITNSQITDERIFAQLGNGLVKFTPVVSAVNELTISNGTAGQRPSIVQTGVSDIGVSFEEVILHNGTITLSTQLADKVLQFNSATQSSYFYGTTVGNIGLYDVTNSRAIWTYNPVANTFNFGATPVTIPTANITALTVPAINGVAALNLVLLATPESLVVSSTINTTWTTVNSATLNAAGAKVALLRVRANRSAAGVATVEVHLRETGSGAAALGTHQVLVGYDSNTGNTATAWGLVDTLIELDSNRDFDWYSGASGSSVSISLLGYYV